MSEPLLKPCPFCGGEAAFGKVTYGHKTVSDQRWDQDTFHQVNCTSCGADNLGIVGHRTPDVAAEKWNTRHGDAPQALSHLGNVLYFGAAIHPDDRNQAFENALAFYNAACPEKQVDGEEHATLRTVHPSAAISEWRDMSTAPKDAQPLPHDYRGPDILLNLGTHADVGSWFRNSTRNDGWWTCHAMPVKPIGWMPVPDLTISRNDRGGPER